MHKPLVHGGGMKTKKPSKPTKPKPPLAEARAGCFKALKMLEAGDPTEAVEALDLVLRLNPPDEIRSLIFKAKVEADIGNPATAETLLGMIDWPLPPDTLGKNEQRAGWAGVTLQRFRLISNTDAADALCDLLADLRHWCDRNEMDFDNELRKANDHYREETRPR